jgi:hypothetical protein
MAAGGAALQNNAELVSRQRDRLRLTLDGGKSIELVDCPYGDDAYHFFTSATIQAGRFYVVPQVVARRLLLHPGDDADRQLYTVYGAPVWTSEKSKFLTIGCSLQPPRNALIIHAPAGEGLATEAEFELPCDSESCSARWDHQSWISVTCVPRDGSGKKGKEFVLMRCQQRHLEQVRTLMRMRANRRRRASASAATAVGRHRIGSIDVST